jgi:hypothetical protein
VPALDTNESDLTPSSGIPPPGESLRTRADPLALKRLLESWMLADATEQRETFDILRRSLDQDRPAGYKLFP